MTNFKTGRIYKIIHRQSNICYVGSTFNRLSDRFRRHKYSFTQYLNNKQPNTSIYSYFQQYGVENFSIILIKEYQVCDKKHLLIYEQLWINKLKPINKNASCQLLKKQKQKQYFEYNKEKQKQWRENNKEKLRQWKEKNKNNRITCVCGSNFLKSNISQHLKTKAHLKKVQSLSN